MGDCFTMGESDLEKPMMDVIFIRPKYAPTTKMEKPDDVFLSLNRNDMERREEAKRSQTISYRRRGWNGPYQKAGIRE